MTDKRIRKDDLVQLILAIADDMISESESLGDLDAQIGDGDLGVTLTLGFQAIKEALEDTKDLDLRGVLSRSGMAFADHAASTFGTLMATMFMGAARVVKGKEAIGPQEGAEMLRAAADGVKKRGKAELGDKTVLDALVPAAGAFEQAAARDESLLQCVEAAVAAAERGAAATVGMRARAGRSGWLGDRTVGVKDPGAAAFVVLMQTVADFMRG
jgi:dihydroxyacetone kinase phosphoprotein-dependent L subunit